MLHFESIKSTLCEKRFLSGSTTGLCPVTPAGKRDGRSGPCGGGGGTTCVSPGERLGGPQCFFLSLYVMKLTELEKTQGFIIDIWLHHRKLYVFFKIIRCVHYGCQ